MFTKILNEKNPIKFKNFFENSEYLKLSLKPRQKLIGHKGCINTCTFNPEGTKLLTGCDDGSIWMWDIENKSNKPLIKIRPHHTNLFTTEFLTSNKIVSGANDATVRVIEYAEGRAIMTSFLEHHSRKVVGLYKYDNNTFISCSYDKTIRIFDLRQNYSRTEISELPYLIDEDYNYHPYERLIHDLNYYQLKPQGAGGGSKNPLINGTCDESLLIDCRKNLKTKFFWIDPHPLDKKTFVVGCSDSTVRIFDIRNLYSTDIDNIKHLGFSLFVNYFNKSITGVKYNFNGEKILASVRGGYVHIFESNTATEIKKNPIFKIQLNQFININDFNYLNQQIGNFFDDITYPPESNIILKHHNSFSTDKTVNWFGKFVISGSDDGDLYIYDPYDLNNFKIIKNVHENNINIVTVNNEKKLLATSGVDYYANVWEPNNL